ncbi:MAG TPA: ATP-grasp domain-containing protein [Acidimicrobiales bacterium]|nr:ATP-grasp domain-containing protein [Acidimicrobiales bacterium]
MTTGEPVTVLVSSAGRRVELLRGFRRALEAVGAAPGRVLATDSSWYSSAFHDADEAFLVPRLGDPEFVPRLLELCVKHRVDLIVPTIDTEMPVWVAHRDQFDEIGTTIALSHGDVVAIAADKQRTHDWLVAEGFPTVEQTTPAGALADPGTWTFPLMAKPRFGSAGLGVALVRDDEELALVGRRGHELGEIVVQRVAPGVEHTIDVLADRTGRCVCAVPRRRIEVRAGEVSKGVTVRSAVLEDLAARMCEALPGAYGALNVQVFVDDPDDLAVIEINARYGGGFPLSLEAGADFPRWMLEELLGLPSTASPDGWRPGLVMLRYDAAVFVDEHRRDE